MHRHIMTAVVACVVLALGWPAAAEIPNRPEKLQFPELSFEIPDADALRFELASGTPVYAKEDREFPLINLSIFFEGGAFIVPAGKEGLAALSEETWRTGGAGKLSAQELDEKLDFLAANLSTSIGEVSGSVSVNFLAKDLDEVLAILMDVLTEPRFQADRFAKAKDDLIQDMKTRNDNAASIEAREWDRLIYGDDHFKNRLATRASVEAITAEDCKALIASMIRADNMVLAVAGDFDRSVMKSKLESTIGALPKLAKPMPEVPQPAHSPAAGVYVVNKEDVNQGRVSIGHLGYREGHPQQFAMMVMNDILGGGGFTSRMMKTVRSDEGLAYGAYSSLGFPITVPGEFRAYFQTKSSTVPYATRITMDLIRGMQQTPVSDEELATSKASFVETFPRRFESAAQTVGTFASGELLGRAPGYWQSYRERIDALTPKDLQLAATEYIHPERMVILVIGNLAEIMEGHPDHEAALSDFGEITELPLRDPLTLQPLSD